MKKSPCETCERKKCPGFNNCVSFRMWFKGSWSAMRRVAMDAKKKRDAETSQRATNRVKS